MTRPNITLGAWSYTKGVNPTINAPQEKHNIHIAKTIYGSHEEALANARLIAAAPQIAAALEDLLADKYLADPINRDRMAKARAALLAAGYTEGGEA